jgi:hypothetical protein
VTVRSLCVTPDIVTKRCQQLLLQCLWYLDQGLVLLLHYGIAFTGSLFESDPVCDRYLSMQVTDQASLCRKLAAIDTPLR